MANATPRDTRAGYDLYRSAGGDLSLGELNSKLFDAGYGPIAQRTLTHYRHLLEAGYNRYISINRFDVARAAEPYENASASGRYRYSDADLGVVVIFAKGSRLFEASGRASDLGEVGALIHFDEPEVVVGLRAMKPQPGDMVTLRYLEAGRSVAGKVVEVDAKSEPALVEIEFSRLISLAVIGVGEPLPAVDVSFVLRSSEDERQTVDVIGSRLYQFFEFVEGVRALSNEALSKQENQRYSEPPVLKGLSVASPAEVILELTQQVHGLIPFALTAALLKVAGQLVTKRKEWLEGTGQQKQNQLTDLEIRLKELELEEKEAESALRAEVLRRLRDSHASSTIAPENAAAIVEKYVLPPLRALGRAGVFELRPEEPVDPTAE